MRSARILLEVLLNPLPEEVARLAQLINASASWQEANQKLAGTGVKFEAHPALVQTGAVGGLLGSDGGVRLNPDWFGRQSDWAMVIAHELTHREQMQRAAASGADTEAVVDRKLASFTNRHGQIDLERYLRDPLEMQALARNAVDAAVRQGQSVPALLRRGGLGRFAPLTPRNTRRFGKYAYQVAQGRALK